jgi:hypothetical protein
MTSCTLVGYDLVVRRGAGWMTSQYQLAPIVSNFLRAHIASVDELELLMLLVMASDRWWDATSSSRELGMSIARARAGLDALASHNLLDIRITEDVRYQFRPGTPDLEAAALALATVYQRTPAAVVHVIARSAPRHVRDFADAFRIRRRERE